MNQACCDANCGAKAAIMKLAIYRVLVMQPDMLNLDTPVNTRGPAIPRPYLASHPGARQMTNQQPDPTTASHQEIDHWINSVVRHDDYPSRLGRTQAFLIMVCRERDRLRAELEKRGG